MAKVPFFKNPYKWKHQHYNEKNKLKTNVEWALCAD
jgi:hypothetical protein